MSAGNQFLQSSARTVAASYPDAHGSWGTMCISDGVVYCDRTMCISDGVIYCDRTMCISDLL